VTRSGGRIGLASWTPEGFIGQFFKVNGRHVPPPAGVRPPLQWGTTERLSELFADVIMDFRIERRFYTFRAQTPEAWIDHFRRWYGPTLKSFEAVGAPGAEALEADLLELIASFNRADDGTMAVPSEASRPSSSAPNHRTSPRALRRRLGLSSRRVPCPLLRYVFRWR
jgi:hypothetical protein